MQACTLFPHGAAYSVGMGREHSPEVLQLSRLSKPAVSCKCSVELHFSPTFVPDGLVGAVQEIVCSGSSIMCNPWMANWICTRPNTLFTECPSVSIDVDQLIQARLNNRDSRRCRRGRVEIEVLETHEGTIWNTCSVTSRTFQRSSRSRSKKYA